MQSRFVERDAKAAVVKIAPDNEVSGAAAAGPVSTKAAATHPTATITNLRIDPPKSSSRLRRTATIHP